MIRLEGVTKIYGNGSAAFMALENVNLHIEKNKFTALVGKSGSGKSTMMNLIGGLDRPSQGIVVVDGENITSYNGDRLALYRNNKIGFVFQSFYLEPTFTVLENVAMPLTIRGMDRAQREQMAMNALYKVDMVGKAKNKASELSGGEKQRVSIARAIVHEPALILADEPCGNLDTTNSQLVMQLLRDICANGKTVMLITHNPDDAKKTDVVVGISDGKISGVINQQQK